MPAFLPPGLPPPPIPPAFPGFQVPPPSQGQQGKIINKTRSSEKNNICSEVVLYRNSWVILVAFVKLCFTGVEASVNCKV